MTDTLENLREEAVNWMEQLPEIVADSLKLNALRDWINSDDRALFNFHKLLVERQHQHLQVPSIGDGISDSLRRRSAPVPIILPRVLLSQEPAPAPDTHYQTIAWRWLQRLVSCGHNTELLEELMVWLARHPSHHDGYDEFFCLWRWLLITKFKHLSMGFDVGPAPVIENLSASQLRDLATQEASWALAFRRMWTDQSPAWETVTYQTSGASFFMPMDGGNYHLNPDTELQMRFGPTHREVHLERGALHVELMTYPLWPFELSIGDLRIRTEAGVFGARRNAGTVSLYSQLGRITVNLARNGQKPKLLLSIHGRERAVLEHGCWSVRPLSVEELERLRTGEKLL